MSEPGELAEPDRTEGTPHPRQTAGLVGQDAAEAAFLAAFNSGRLHHAWLLTGPRGVGKSTLAWRIARFCLSQPSASDTGMFAAGPPQSLATPEDHPICRRILALSEPRLFLLRRGHDEKTSRLRAVIGVDEVRKLKGFFQMSAPDGGRRVVIVDAADEMNPSAANAILKLLEEPPADTVMLLISHRPSGLLPTIRSRCRALRCPALGPEDMATALAPMELDVGANASALAELAGGSVGEAVRLLNLDGLANYARIVALFATLPRMDRPTALALAETAAGKGAEERFELMIGLIELFLARLARTGVGGPPPAAAPKEAVVLTRLSPDPQAARTWADLAQHLSSRARRGKAVNLDPAALILDMFLAINETAAKLPA